MDGYLPAIYRDFRESFPDVTDHLDSLAASIDAAGGLDERSIRFIKLGIAIGLQSEGAVRSNVRKALAVGAKPEEIRQAALLAITTAGFPAAVAALGWAEVAIAET